MRRLLWGILESLCISSTCRVLQEIYFIFYLSLNYLTEMNLDLYFLNFKQYTCASYLICIQYNELFAGDSTLCFYAIVIVVIQIIAD
jgi:hypothetical protein